MISYLIIPDSKVIKEYLSYGLLAVTAVLLFLLFGGGNKWFSNLVYVFILLPSVFFIRKYLYAVKKIKAVMVLLFLYSFYSALVLLIDGEGVESFKYFLMLVLFYFFVLINFNSNLNEDPENIYSVFYPTVAGRVVKKDINLSLPQSEEGIYTLILEPMDPGIVFEKIIVDFGGYKETHLFMNETPKKR